jgi:transcriptional regulator with XRE-family HTH domain
MEPDRRIKGRPLTDLLDSVSELKELEQQKREIDARLRQLRNSQGGMLRSAREDTGMSVKGLAASLGKSPSYISQVENGVRGASSETVMAFVSTISTSSSGSGTWNEGCGPLIKEDEDGNEDSAKEEGLQGSSA